MRIDHLAFRVINAQRTARFFKDILGYRVCRRVPQGFQVDFADGTYAKCHVLVPPERIVFGMPWRTIVNCRSFPYERQEYHQPPEIFISEGSPDSIVERWVQDNGNGLHHIALQVPSIDIVKEQWEREGHLNFASQNVLTCPGLKQIFTKPDELTGVIWELIERQQDESGFCEDNVKNLMLSSDSRLE